MGSGSNYFACGRPLSSLLRSVRNAEIAGAYIEKSRLDSQLARTSICGQSVDWAVHPVGKLGETQSGSINQGHCRPCLSKFDRHRLTSRLKSILTLFLG